jgi:ABC-2 type transport system permease protein
MSTEPRRGSVGPAPRARGVVSLVVRLRLAMWRTSMSRSALHLVSSILGGVAAVVALGVFGPSLLLLVGQPLRIVALTVPAFAVVAVLWAVLPLIATGVDSILDPARFAVLPLRAGDLARGLLAAGVTGIPGLLLIGLALAQVGSWSRSAPTALAALMAAVLGVLTAVLLSRAVTSGLGRAMTTRAGRNLGAVIVALATLLPLGFDMVVTSGSIGIDGASVDATRAATVASWTPVGWAWALPFDVATGRWISAFAHLTLALMFAAGLYLVWVRLLARALTSPLTSAGGQRIGRGRLLPLLLGTSPVASVAGRRVRAWYRDSRLVSIALRTAVMPVFFMIQGVFTGTTGLVGAGVVMLGVLAGLTLMNDLAFDGPSWWMHVAVGVRGWEDRLGRAVASVVVFGPAVGLVWGVGVGLGVVSPALPWLAVALAAFFASLGLAVLVGAYLPGTAPRTGGNPFAATSGGAAQGCLTALLSLVGPIVLVLPVVVLAIVASGRPLGEWLVTGAGAAYGLGLLGVGVVLGGRRIDRRAPELLGQLQQSQV